MEISHKNTHKKNLNMNCVTKHLLLLSLRLCCSLLSSPPLLINIGKSKSSSPGDSDLSGDLFSLSLWELFGGVLTLGSGVWLKKYNHLKVFVTKSKTNSYLRDLA